MRTIKAIILDFDGVLAESNAVKDAAFVEFFSRYPEHAAAMEAYHLAHYAEPRQMKFAYFIEELMGRPGDAGAVERMAEAFSELVAERVIACPEVPGASDFLAEFSPYLPLYISSVTPQAELGRIIVARGVAPHIRRAFGNPPTPKVDAVATVLKDEGLEPGEVAFVGDSESDRQVAVKTGLVFFGRDSGQLFADAELAVAADLGAVADRLRTLL